MNTMPMIFTSNLLKTEYYCTYIQVMLILYPTYLIYLFIYFN